MVACIALLISLIVISIAIHNSNSQQGGKNLFAIHNSSEGNKGIFICNELNVLVFFESIFLPGCIFLVYTEHVGILNVRRL